MKDFEESRNVAKLLLKEQYKIINTWVVYYYSVGNDISFEVYFTSNKGLIFTFEGFITPEGCMEIGHNNNESIHFCGRTDVKILLVIYREVNMLFKRIKHD